jgi:YesN/AraC family two-component response regulator
MTQQSAKTLRELWWEGVADEARGEELTPARRQEILESQQRLQDLTKRIEARKEVRLARVEEPKQKGFNAIPEQAVKTMRRLFAKGMTLTNIAKKLQVNVSTVGKYVKGYHKSVKMKTMKHAVGRLMGSAIRSPEEAKGCMP